MNPVHIVTEKENIFENVIMPGDPLRAKYIAENFLENAKLVNTTRNMFIYSGVYKNKLVTIAASGMGMPSMGIYAYELYKFYGVKNIIRIGTCGALSKEVKINDIVIADKAYSVSNYNEIVNNDKSNNLDGNKYMNDLLEENAKNLQLKYKRGNIYTSDVFDVYINVDKYLRELNTELLIAEMEAFGLFSIAKHCKKNATAIATVVDSKFESIEISPMDREKSLNNMIVLALETIKKL